MQIDFAKLQNSDNFRQNSNTITLKRSTLWKIILKI